MTKKSTTKKTSAKSTAKPRQVALPKYKSFKLSKRIKHPKKIIGAFRLLKRSLKHIWQNKKVFLGITLVYLVLTLVFVKGFGLSGEVSELRSTLEELFSEEGTIFTGITLYGLLIGSAGSASSEIGGLYQTILLVVVSLAVIWAMRQTYANEKVTTKQVFYGGMYPLVPFLLVLLVIGLQLIPLIIGSGLYNIVMSSGLAVNGFEQFVWVVLFGMLALLSAYMISSSIFALYIVTLPNMTPMQALRSARELVQLRRWTVMRKVLFLPLILIIGAAFIMVPLLLAATAVAEYIFFVMTMFGLVLAHSYLYTLYRELL